MVSSSRLKLSIIICYEKDYFLKKIKSILYYLEKHSKILLLEISGDF